MTDSKLDHRFRMNIIMSIMSKGLSVLLGLASVNIYLGYLGNVNYGLWITISSVASWAAMGDLGIGNGLRNELSKAYAEGDKARQDILVKTALSTLSKLSIIIFIILSAATECMIHLGILESIVRIPMYITNFFMCVCFVMGIASSVAHAFQLSYFSSLSLLLYTLLNIVVILVLSQMSCASNLTVFAIVNGVSNVVAHIILMAALKKKAGISFGFCKTVDKTYVKAIIGTGVQFFVLQLCGLILYSTDNVIINKLFGSAEVTTYTVITKIFNTGETLFSILLVSMWSAVTFQWTLGQYEWIWKKIKHLLLLWLGFSLGVVGVSLFFNTIVLIWLRESAIHYEPGIIILFGVYTISGTFGAIFLNVANGIGKVKLQLIMVIIEAIANIPLSILFARNCHMGISGVKLATLICNTGANIIMPVYIIVLIRKKISQRK